MAMLQVGDTLDIFVLGTLLHDGPLADIFLAEDRLSGLEVVLKIPRTDILNHPVLLYHYQNEDRISRLLDHPGVVRFIHRQKSRQYIIMEYARGRDLRSKIGRNRPMAFDASLGFMSQLCTITAYLHDLGVVHLDLKPENIICNNQSVITVIDFGLACCRHLPDLLAMDLQTPLGSPWYIAPEQLLGYRAGPGCDIYAMGMIFYEMLTGRLPWAKSSNLRIARRRLGHDPTPPRYYNSAIPSQIQDIILRALARHSEKRYQSVSEMALDLKNWQQLPITETGRRKVRKPWWKRIFPHNSVQPSRAMQRPAPPTGEKPQIIGALIDAPGSGNMLVELKKQALIHSAEVTLVHCIEEENDSHFRRYGITVEGEKLMARLENGVQLLRRCSIDPSIRLIRGEVVEVLRDLSDDLHATQLILGDSRKKGGALGSASVRNRLIENNPCRVVIAASDQFCPVSDLASCAPEELTANQVLACDIFLVDLWYDHLHFHATCVYDALLHRQVACGCNDDNCVMGTFLDYLGREGKWRTLIAPLVAIHKKLHVLTEKMVTFSNHDLEIMHDLYVSELLPASCHLKNELSAFSRQIRQHLVEHPPEVPFLTELTCPFAQPDLPCYGPLLKAMTLQTDIRAMVRERKGFPELTKLMVECNATHGFC